MIEEDSSFYGVKIKWDFSQHEGQDNQLLYDGESSDLYNYFGFILEDLAHYSWLVEGSDLAISLPRSGHQEENERQWDVLCERRDDVEEKSRIESEQGLCFIQDKAFLKEFPRHMFWSASTFIYGFPQTFVFVSSLPQWLIRNHQYDFFNTNILRHVEFMVFQLEEDLFWLFFAKSEELFKKLTDHLGRYSNITVEGFDLEKARGIFEDFQKGELVE